METFDVETCRSKFARYYQKTAKIPTSVWASVGRVELDKLYTRLSWVKKEQTPTGPSLERLRYYTDLFTAEKDDKVPKRILAQGETGIGKSTFVKKLTVDWAELDDAEMTEEQKDALRKFKLVVALPLKNVSTCKTLDDIISCSQLFPKDEKTSTDDLLSYIRDNQEKVLLVFDGYDEYRTGNEAETQFGSRSDSPICEIFQGNNLRDCTVLVTCRISQADELQKDADKHAEVTGFDQEDKRAFMMKMLNSESKVQELISFLSKNKMDDLARVPLLNLFFCLLWKEAKDKLEGLTKTKTKLYQAIVRHILQYRHHKYSSRQVSKVKEENYKELLAEIGKVALEGLLKGNQVFEYGQLSEKVRGEKSLMVGLFQLSEHGASLDPTEVVSFIHKSIQEYLAAWYITYRCVPEGNLGGVEEHARTLQDCKELENVFQFVCGLSEQGAVKIFNHLATIRISDPSVDLSNFIPDEENGTNWSSDAVTERQRCFSDLVLNFFQECSSKAEVVTHFLHCTGGMVFQDNNCLASGEPSLLKVFTQGALSWTFIFECHTAEGCNNLYESVKFLECLYEPVHFSGSLVEIKLGEFLTKFMHTKWEFCSFTSMLCCRDDRIQFYIRRLVLGCDAHARVFTEPAAAISDPSLSGRELCSNQPCLKFLSYLWIIGLNDKSMKDLGALIGNCKHLKKIKVYSDILLDHSAPSDCVCDLLGQVKYPESCSFKFGSWVIVNHPLTLTSDGAEKLAGLLPRLRNIIRLHLDVSECCATAVTTLVLFITHKTLEHLGLTGIRLSPSASASLGQVLPEMSSLKTLVLIGADGSILKAEEMKWLFGGFNKPLPLEDLYFNGFSVRGCLSPLTESFRFFPELLRLYLEKLDLNERDLCDLLKSFTFLPKMEVLSLRGNPLGHAVTSIVPHLINLPNLSCLNLEGTDCSDQDKRYVLDAVEQVRLGRMFPFTSSHDGAGL